MVDERCDDANNCGQVKGNGTLVLCICLLLQCLP